VNLSAFATIGASLITYALVSRRLSRLSVTGPMFFMLIGLAIGPTGLGFLEGSFDEGLIEVLAELTLVVLLFTDASRIDVVRLRQNVQIPVRLLAVAMPLGVGLGTLAGKLLIPGAGIAELALLAAVLIPTDAALGQAVVSNPRVPGRIRQALNVESGLNDGLILPAITILTAVAAAELGDRSAGVWAEFAARQIGFGVLIGVGAGAAGGVLLDKAWTRGWVEGVMRQISALSIAAVAFSLAEVVGGNGFVAAFLAGLAFGTVARGHCESAAEFAEDQGHLLTLLTFLFFGAVLVGPELGQITPTVALYSLLSLTLVRMLPTAVALVGMGLEPPTIAFLGWFGPRGLASILFGVSVLHTAELSEGTIFTTAVTTTVALSVVLHGATSVPFSAAYARWFDTMDDVEMAEGVAVEEIRPRGGMRSDP
jgi:NhaP-type Na+/H+ or K+/H+ antiporter